ncbi:hypothetical protein Tco_1227026 [Tanacetum coccineum]
MVANKKPESSKVDHLVIKRKKEAPIYRKNNKQNVSSKRRKNDHHRKESSKKESERKKKGVTSCKSKRTQQKARDDSKSKSKEDVSESMSMGNIYIGGLVSHLLDVPDHIIGKVIFLSNRKKDSKTIFLKAGKLQEGGQKKEERSDELQEQKNVNESKRR